MKHVTTFEDVYPAIDELIAELNSLGYFTVATVLSHRMYKVAWNARSELFEELKNILPQLLNREYSALSEIWRQQIRRILAIISNAPRSP